MANEVNITVKVDDKTKAGWAGINKGAKDTEEKAGGSLKRFSVGALAAGGAVGAVVVGLGKKTLSLASDSQQSLGATQSVFGKYSDAVVAKSKKASDAYGLSANDYRESANQIGSLLKNQGVAQDELGGKTDALIGKAADLSATFGGSTADAVEALSSAFKGEYDPLEKYGISLKQSTVNAEAMRVAHVASTAAFNKLTPAAQAAATQMAVNNLITKQTGEATGQFQKQTNTLAEKQQILKAKLSDAGAALGTKLLPVLTKAATIGVKVLGWMQKNPAAAYALAGAVGVLAAAFVALAIAEAATGFNEIILGITALVAGFIYAWKSSQKFREIVSTAFAGIATAILTGVRVYIQVLKVMVDATLTAVIGVLNALGHLPGGAGAKFRAAAKEVSGFKKSVDTAMNAAVQKTKEWQAAVNRMPKTIKLNGQISDLQSKISAAKASLRGMPPSRQVAVRANIAQLQTQLNRARAALSAIQGKTIVIHGVVVISGLSALNRAYNGNTHTGGHAAGGIIGAASGGARGGLTWVGEQGPELVRLPYGSNVMPHGSSVGVAARSAGAPQQVTLQLEASDSATSRFLLEILRKSIRVKGGNVQVVLGQ